MDQDQARRELDEMLQAAEADLTAGRLVPAEEADAQFEALLSPKNTVYLTGDTHGRFERIVEFCAQQEVEPENTFIILGDAGLNYYKGRKDLRAKELLSQLPVTFFCIHGNHEMRPSPELGYKLSSYHGGQVWVQPEYPNLLFAVDGEVYDFMGHSCLVIGGAYSVDKWYRLRMGYGWWPDEQPSDEIKAKVERVLEERDWKVDVVLSHTCPFRYEPTEAFLPGLDQSTVDDSTERWLDAIERRLSYARWYCGHFHIEKKIDKLRFLFNDYALLPHEINIEKEQELIRRVLHQAEIVEALGLLDDKEDPAEQ